MVTGAGSGIGRATALLLAKRRGERRRHRPRRRTGGAGGSRDRGDGASVVGACVSTSPDRQAWRPRFFDDVITGHGSVQLLMNNAGVALTGPFLGCSLDDLEWQLDVNLRGVMYGCHTFLPHLLEQNEAHLVNVSSIFGIVSMPDNAAYCASKHAVRALTEAIELEHPDSRVRFSSVHPGAVATNIVSSGRFRSGGFLTPDLANRAIDRGISPEKAATIVVDGIQRDVRRILIGRDAHFLARFSKRFPCATEISCGCISVGTWGAHERPSRADPSAAVEDRRGPQRCSGLAQV